MIDFIRHIFDLSVSSYGGACFWIIFGLFMISFTRKNPQKYEYSALQGDIKGRVAGYGGVSAGIAIVILKLFGKI